MNVIYLKYAQILIPLILSNSLHMVAVKKNWLRGLAIPIQENWFGKNKTLRGLIFLPVANGFFSSILSLVVILWLTGNDQKMTFWFLVLSLPFLLLILGAGLQGAAYGLVYMLSELPNSWLKRRLGIKPGETPAQNAWLFHLLDKTDSALGVSLYAWITLPVLDFYDFLQLFLISAGIHILFSWLLHRIRVKKSF